MFSKTCIVIFSAAIVGLIATGVDPPVPGGFHPISSDDPHLQPCVNFAAAELNKRCNCAFCQTIVNVSNASEKIVSGAIFNFTMTLAQSSTCKVDQCYITVSPKECPPDVNARPYACKASVKSHPWLPVHYELLSLICEQ